MRNSFSWQFEKQRLVHQPNWEGISMLCLGMQWSSLKLGLDSKSDGSSARKTWYFIPVWIVKSRLKEPSEDQTPQYASITSRSDSTNWCLFVVSFFITSTQLEIYLPSLVNVTNITNLTNEKNQLYKLWLTISQKYKFHIIYIYIYIYLTLYQIYGSPINLTLYHYQLSIPILVTSSMLVAIPSTPPDPPTQKRRWKAGNRWCLMVEPRKNGGLLMFPLTLFLKSIHYPLVNCYITMENHTML